MTDEASTRATPGPRGRWSGLRLAAGSQVRRRVRRIAPGLLPLPARVAATSCWLVLAALAGVCLTPGLLPLSETEALVWPGWFWALVVAGLATFAAAAAVPAGYLGRRIGDGVAVLALAAAVLVLALLPAGASLYAGSPAAGVVWLLADATLAALLAVSVLRLRRRGRPGLAVPAAIGVLAAAPWLATVFWLDDPLFADYLASQVALLAGTVFFVGAFLGLTRTAQERHLHARRWLGGDPSTRLVLGVLVGVAVLTVARFTLARGLFGDNVARLWSLRDWTSWPHAVLVAGLMLVCVDRSCSRPLRGDGQAAVTWFYVVAGVSGPLLLQVDAAIVAVRSAVTQRVVDAWGLLDWSSEVQLVLVAATGWFVVRSRYAGTAGRVMATVGLVYLTPALVAIMVEFRTSVTLPAVWASAAQVVVALIVLVAALLGLNRLTGRDWIRPWSAVRLLVVPALTVQGAALIPLVLEHRLGGALAVTAIVVGLVWSMPPVAADRSRHARVVLTAAAGAVVALTTYLITTAVASTGTSVTVWAVLWLAIPVAAVLACDVRDPQGSSARGPGTHRRLARSRQQCGQRRG